MELTPHEINNGDCDRFVDTVCSKTREERVRIAGFDGEFEGYHWVGHFWVEYKGSHYEAECHNSIDNFLDLLIFKKQGLKKDGKIGGDRANEVKVEVLDEINN